LTRRGGDRREPVSPRANAKQFMQKLWTHLERWLGVVAMLALFSLVVLPALQVVLRGVFNNPITGLEESTRWGLIILVFVASPLLISANEHIRLAEFVDLLPRRVRVLLERIILLVSGLSLAIVALAGGLSIWRNFGTRTPILDIPFWLFAAPMLVGFALGAIGYVWYALRRKPPTVDGPTPVI